MIYSQSTDEGWFSKLILEFTRMESTVIRTIINMIETLPEQDQQVVVEHLRYYVEELRDGAQWDNLVTRTKPKLIEAARQARRQIRDGLAEPFDTDRL